MAINLQKGQRIDLRKNTGTKLERFCVGANWGAIVTEVPTWFGLSSKKEVKDVDLDLSCVMLDANGNLCDHIYSPLYRTEILSKFGLPMGKLQSADGAIHHSGDDRGGDQDGDDGLDNEIITIDLTRVAPRVHQIFFFLNNVGKEDFWQIPYTKVRLFEGTPKRVNSVFASYDVSKIPEFKGKQAMILGKLYRHGDDWKFHAIGDATDDRFLGFTIQRIVRDYK